MQLTSNDVVHLYSGGWATPGTLNIDFDIVWAAIKVLQNLDVLYSTTIFSLTCSGRGGVVYKPPTQGQDQR